MIESSNFIAIPPGATIKEQLDIKEMTLLDFSEWLDFSEEIALRLLEGKVELTHAVALKLESLLGVPSSFWNNLESAYREQLIVVEADTKTTINN